VVVVVPPCDVKEAALESRREGLVVQCAWVSMRGGGGVGIPWCMYISIHSRPPRGAHSSTKGIIRK